MSRKFTIKVAGAEWNDQPGWSRLENETWLFGRIYKRSSRNFEAEPIGRTTLDGFKTLAAAKAYVIKQLAGAGKEKK